VEEHLHLVGLACDCRWLHRPTRLAKQLTSVSIHDRQVVPSASPGILKAECSEAHLDLLSCSRTDLVSLVLAGGIVVGVVLRLDRPALSRSSASARAASSTATFTIRDEALDPRKESLHPCVDARGGVSATSAIAHYSNQSELAVLGDGKWTSTVSLASVCALSPGTQLAGGGGGADVAAALLAGRAQHLDNAFLQCALLRLLGSISRGVTNGASPPGNRRGQVAVILCCARWKTRWLDVGSELDVFGQLKYSNVIVVAAIVGVVDDPFRGNPTTSLIGDTVARVVLPNRHLHICDGCSFVVGAVSSGDDVPLVDNCSTTEEASNAVNSWIDKSLVGEAVLWVHLLPPHNPGGRCDGGTATGVDGPVLLEVD